MNHRQKLFALEYLQSGNATQAAIAAGYSKKTARSIGSENLTKPDIQRLLKKTRSEILKNAELNLENAVVQLDAVVNFDPRKAHGKSPEEWDDKTAMAIGEYTETFFPNGILKERRFKQHSKNAGLDMQFKRKGDYVNESNVLNRMSDEQIDFLIEKLRDRLKLKIA